MGYTCILSKLKLRGLSEAYGTDVALKLYKGDITALENTASIVNFVFSDDVYGRMGVLEAAGNRVKHEYKTKRLQPNIPYVAYGVVKTNAGTLPYKAIFHVEVFDELPMFKSAIHRVLRLADQEGMRSIAFPALDCSRYKKYVDGYLQIFYEFENRIQPCCLHMIDIVCNTETDYDYHSEKMKIMGEKLNWS